jgi:ATP-binding cassette, subfamily C (CFTR/MRP), member 1
MSTVNLLDGPLNMLGQGLPYAVAGYASLKRVQTFLDMDEKGEGPSTDNAEDETVTDRDIAEVLGPNVVLQLKSTSFSWLPDSTIVLDAINLELQKGQFYMVIGPVASVRYQKYYSIVRIVLCLPSSLCILG